MRIKEDYGLSANYRSQIKHEAMAMVKKAIFNFSN